MADADTKRLQARLSDIHQRLKALDDADDQASWGGSAARGGFRQERLDLMKEAEAIRVELGKGST